MLTSERPVLTMGGHYSINAAARVLGIHRHTMRRYADQYGIKYSIHKATGRIYFLGKTLMEFWESNF